jgi:chemotaxis protein methyltransferase CheR
LATRNPLAAAQPGQEDASAFESAASRLSQAQFEVFRELADRHAGIALPDYKRSMVHRRLSKRMKALGLADFSAYAELLADAAADGEIEFFVNALTTNKTDFYREGHHFDHLAAVALANLRKFLDRDGSRRLRFWSAGCSTGQEPYSIAMTLLSAFGDLARWDAKILATDIDTDVLEIGRKGVYPEEEVSRIPPAVRQRYVNPAPGEKDRFVVCREARSLVTFNPLNLHAIWPMKGKFDVVFCRNVIIYFDKPTQRTLFDRLANHMQEGGYLYIGHSETLYKVSERFQPVGQNIYQRIM